MTEDSGIRQAKLIKIGQAVRQLISVFENPERQGLQDTPLRVAKAFLDHWASGYFQDPANVLKTFDDGAEGYDEMVLQRDIPIWSMCEHHLAPFFGVAHVAYVPDRKIVGLSKISRLVDVFARRFQVQERLTSQIAEAMVTHLRPKGVGVVIEARHLCMESRGIKTHGTRTTTSSLKGVFLQKSEARAEFMSLIR